MGVFAEATLVGVDLHLDLHSTDTRLVRGTQVSRTRGAARKNPEGSQSRAGAGSNAPTVTIGSEHAFVYALAMANDDLGYRLEVTLRSLASTRQADGNLVVQDADARDLLELLESSARAVSEVGHLRRRLLEVTNDPSSRAITVPLREVAALLRLDNQSRR